MRWIVEVTSETGVGTLLVLRYAILVDFDLPVSHDRVWDTSGTPSADPETKITTMAKPNLVKLYFF